MRPGPSTLPFGLPRRTAALSLCLALIASTPVVSAQFRLQILHTSDLEGGVSAVQDAPRFAALVDGFEREAQRAGIASVLLSAGDNYLLGPFYHAAEDPLVGPVLRAVLDAPLAPPGPGRVDIGIMNILGFDASALGNHELDPGPATFKLIVSPDPQLVGAASARLGHGWPGARFPYLAANLDVSDDPHLGPLHAGILGPGFDDTHPRRARIADAVVLTRGGERIAVVGATTPLLASISSPGASRIRGVASNHMHSLARVLQPTIDRLVASGVDKVVLLSHLQDLNQERALLPLLQHVDVVVGGGSETMLAGPGRRLREGDRADGDYPEVLRNATGDPAVLVSTAGQYRYLGRLVLSFDRNGILLPSSIRPRESGPYPVDDAAIADLWGEPRRALFEGGKAWRVSQLTEAVSRVVSAKDGVLLGRSAVFLEGRRHAVRRQETNLGNLVADAMLDAARRVDRRVVVAVMNGGGIRASIGTIDRISGEPLPPAGNPRLGKPPLSISRLDVENTLRFDNTLTALSLTARQLEVVLEHAVAISSPGATPGRFPQIAGLRFSFDPGRPAGERVRTAALAVAGTDTWQAVIEDGEVTREMQRSNLRFRLVTSRFLADGGDGYPFPTLVAEDPALERTDLHPTGRGPGARKTLTDREALIRYLARHHSRRPFDRPDTPASGDMRIQNLSLRDDQVLAAATRSR